MKGLKWCSLHDVKFEPEDGCCICKSVEEIVELAMGTPEPPDMVNSPPHYASGEIECIDAMVQVFGIDAVKTYARINHFKYLWRHRYKNSEEQDLAKADWYWRFSQGDDPRAQT